MPAVLGYTPEWLCRPSPGYHLFAPRRPKKNNHHDAKNHYHDPRKNNYNGPRRTIATRGSEVFVAVGTELRWADLARVKDGGQPAYRALRVAIPLPITRLAVSPDGDYLCVATSHTVHVVHVPQAVLFAHADDDDTAPLKLRAFQVGPTVHVLEEAPVASVLWHPLGYHGRCLVTVTRAGVVRLWELNHADRATFSEPALSIDLPKLANATTDQDDLAAAHFAASKGFSPDSVELEVAAACFGDAPDQEGVHGWAPMTLWIATVPGDIYALCPLLPSKWQLIDAPGAFTFLNTLTSSIHLHYANLADDDEASPAERKTSEKQVAWLADLLYEEPFHEELPNGDSMRVFYRPTSAPPVPLLQGPFAMAPDVDDFELSDIIVYSLKTLSESSEEDAAMAAEGLPTAVVCLLTETSKVHVCLDLDGIAGRWLPAPEDDVDVQDLPSHDLIIAETITLIQSDTPSYNQSITPDVHMDFSFFVSHASGIFYISLESWIRKLETELSEPQTEGADFRLKRILESASTSVEQPLIRKTAGDIAEQLVTSVAVIEDGNIGYLLLTTIDDEPVAVQLDAPEDGLPSEEEIAGYMAISGPVKQVREAWQPPKELYEPFDILASIHIPSRHRSFLKEEIRLSPANLELLMDVHRVLSVQTSKLQHAVSDLFNRATRLQEEFRDQVYRTSQIAANIDNVIGDGAESVDSGSDLAFSTYGATNITSRLARVQSRQDALNSRYESLRRKMAATASPEISDKEAAWIEEIQVMHSAVDAASRTLTYDVDGTADEPIYQRFDKLRRTKEELVEQAAKVAKNQAHAGRRSEAVVKVPGHTRTAENEMIAELIQRNTVLVDAAAERLRGLGVSVALDKVG